MKIFLSWSGEGTQSHRLAQAFKEWLPSVFQSVKPFLSSKDIYAGVQWFPKLKTELEAADFGIVCLTKNNLTAAREWSYCHESGGEEASACSLRSY